MRNRGNKVWIGVLVCILICSYTVIVLAQGESVTIAQVSQEAHAPERIHLRIETSNRNGQPIENLSMQNITNAFVGTGNVPVIGMSRTNAEQGDGMAYVFVLDQAMPANSNRLKEMKTGLNQWIEAMTDRDYAAILFSTDRECINYTDGFTNDKRALYAAVDALRLKEKGENKNQIYMSLKEAIELAGSRSEIPLNRVVITCTNGVDSYQTQVRPNEIQDMLKTKGITLYVVGFAYSTVKRELATLMDIAQSSGGWSEDATPTNERLSIDEAFSALRRRIMGGYDIIIDCSDGFVANGLTQFALEFDFLPLPVKRQADITLQESEKRDLPQILKGDEAGEPQQGRESKIIFEEVSKFLNNLDSKLLRNILSITIIVGTAIFIIIRIIHRQEPRKYRAYEHKDTITPFPNPAGDIINQNLNSLDQMDILEIKTEQRLTAKIDHKDIEEQHRDDVTIRPSLQEQTERSMWNADISIKKNFAGQAEGVCIYRLMEGKPLIIGRSSTCDIKTNEDDIRVSKKHAQLCLEEQRIVVRNISAQDERGDRNRLLANGTLVEDKHEINSGTILLLGETSMELNWEVIKYGNYAKREAVTNRCDDVKQSLNGTLRLKPCELCIEYQLMDDIMRGTYTMQRYFTIGRGCDNDLCISNPMISEKHVRIEQKYDGKFYITNTSSEKTNFGKNPAYVNQRMVMESCELSKVSEIMLGEVILNLTINQMQ